MPGMGPHQNPGNLNHGAIGLQQPDGGVGSATAAFGNIDASNVSMTLDHSAESRH